jgi:DNA-directed RNA polymerase specialized sigma24 family protein
LGEPARTAVLLHYQQGLTYEEMVVVCDEEPGTLQARVARALRAPPELHDLLTQERLLILDLQAQG